jgi:hypothetical protein
MFAYLIIFMEDTHIVKNVPVVYLTMLTVA